MKNRLESILNHANEGILIVNRAGYIVLANPRSAELFGYSIDEILQLSVDDLVPNSAKGNHQKHREAYSSNPSNRPMGKNMTLRGVKKDGSEFPVEISLSHYEAEGELFVTAFIIDITERFVFQENLQRINKELLQLNENLERKVKERTLVLQEALNDLEKSRDELTEKLEQEKELHEMKSRFVSMASHEFRTPLTTILSSVSLISKYQKEEEQTQRDKHIQRIKNAVFSLTETLNDVLSLGKLDEGKVEVQLEEVNICDVLTQVQNEMELIVREGQEIEVHCDSAVMAYCDSSLLHRAIVNLVSNAIKFSDDNTPLILSVSEKHSLNDAKQVGVSVSNTGIGIPKDEQQKLFDRFYRARNAFNIQGTGLGLSIVKRCCELMNAQIEWESEENKQTTFTIYLPSKP
jgi:PAS domain S-box-containing protein